MGDIQPDGAPGGGKGGAPIATVVAARTMEWVLTTIDEGANPLHFVYLLADAGATP